MAAFQELLHFLLVDFRKCRCSFWLLTQMMRVGRRLIAPNGVTSFQKTNWLLTHLGLLSASRGLEAGGERRRV